MHWLTIYNARVEIISQLSSAKKLKNKYLTTYSLQFAEKNSESKYNCHESALKLFMVGHERCEKHNSDCNVVMPIVYVCLLWVLKIVTTS